MRAWHVTAHGEPEDVLALVEVDDPVPGPGEVRVRVHAVAANFPDVLLARGQYQVRPELPFTPGVEFAGTVAAVGEGVTRWQPGTWVIGGRIGVLSEQVVMPTSATTC